MAVLSQAQAQYVASKFNTHGGVTFDTKAGKDAESGISIAVPGHEERYEGGVSTSDVAGYSLRHVSALNAPGAHLGGWRTKHDDGSVDKDFLDVAYVQPGTIDHPVQRAVAKGTMVKNHQIAAWDIGKGKIDPDNAELANPYYDENPEVQRKNVMNVPVSVRKRS
jgi:hypothetical protein